MQKMKWKTKRSAGAKGLIVFCSVIIAAICLCKISLLDGLRIMDDEYAYWGMGAHFAGFHWESMQHSPFYSYGYSLLLVPLFWLMKAGISVTAAYKLAIMINILLLLVSFWLSLKVAEHYAREIPAYYRILCCFITTLYINNIVQTGYAWDETLLYFMFWVILYTFIRAIENPSYGNILLFILASVYIVMIHMRAVGVFLSAIAVLVLYFLCEKRAQNYKKILVAIAGFSIGILVFILGKEYVTQNIYGNANTVNTLEGQIGKMSLIFSVSGIIDLCNSMLGKVFYQGAASFLMTSASMCYGICYLLKTVWLSCRSRKIQFESKTWMILFIEAAVIAELAVSAVFKVIRYYSQSQVVSRIDNIYYGRYADFVVGPILLAGLLLLYRARKNIVYFAAAALGIAVSAIAVQSQFNVENFYLDFPEFVGNPSAFAGISYMIGGSYTNLAYRILAFSFIGCVICILLSLWREKAKGPILSSVILVIILVGVWTFYGVERVEEAATEKNWRDKAYRSIAELADRIAYENEIYFVEESDQGYTKWIQWWMPTYSFHEITYDEFSDLNENGLMNEVMIFANATEKQVMGLLSNQMHYIYNSGSIGVFVPEDSILKEEIEKQIAESYAYSDPHWYEIDLAQVKTDLCDQKPDGSLHFNWDKEGYMTWATGVSLKDGIYEFQLDLDIADFSEGAGYITITNEEGTYLDTYVLQPEYFDRKGQGEIAVQIPVENYEHPVIGLYVDGEHSVRINEMRYRQVNSQIKLQDEEEFSSFSDLLKNLSSVNNMQLCYIDSDASGECGFPDFSILNKYFPTKISEYVPGNLLAYRELQQDKILIVENSVQFKIYKELLSDFAMIGYGESYSLWIPRIQSVLRELEENAISVLTPFQNEIGLGFLGEAIENQGCVYKVVLPDGRYKVHTHVTTEGDVNGWLTVNEEKQLIEQTEDSLEFYIQGEENTVITLLPEVEGKWKSSSCTISWEDENRLTEIPYDRMQAEGVLQLEGKYAVTGENASLLSEPFQLGARHYGIGVTIIGEDVEGYAEYYRNGELRGVVSAKDALKIEEGKVYLEYVVEEYDLSQWQVKVILEGNKEIAVHDKIRVLEYR